MKFDTINGIKIYESKNPPVGPKITPIPPLKPAKTGSPNMPRRRYKITDGTDIVEFSINDTISTRNNPEFNGIVPIGKLIGDKIDMIVQSNAIFMRFLFFIYILSKLFISSAFSHLESFLI